MTLTEFLLARIAEDEALLATPMSRRMIGRKMVEVPMQRLPAYVERDRNRWAAECEAKRRIVERYNRSQASRVKYPNQNNIMSAVVMTEVLQMLAVPYADHPDYDEAWRP